VDGGPEIQIERPRDVFEIIEVTFKLYRRYPALWFVLAAGVVVPYEVIVLILTGAGPFAQGHAGTVAYLVLTITDSFLVGPLISALHVHGVRDVRDGKRPEPADVARRSLLVLPVVSAAVIIALLGATAALFAFIVPGILLYLRWSVAAQAAALEDGGWIDALRLSRKLTHRNYWHIIGVFFLSALIVGVPFALVGIAFGHTHTTAASFLAGTVLRIVASSFSALATAILYFDLVARSKQPRATLDRLPSPTVPQVPPKGHPLDPMSWSDQDRPAGWYMDTENPKRMRFWPADGHGVWSTRTAKTPKETLAEWERAQQGEES
jgi:hypothetical protein